jgi:osmoprotectant transport system ATP-binding protein
VIEIDALTKFYGATPVVSSLSLSVPTGELLVLIGASGSGKTTTLKMINRIIEPTSGTVRIDGRDTASEPGHALRRRVGYVFQKIGLLPHLTVGENVGLPLELHGIKDPGLLRRRVAEMLALVELDGDLAIRYPRDLSGGQQQRVGVARALIARPLVMLLDEPFGALDPLTRDRLQRTFREIHRSLRLTTVFVTHDMAEALLLADRIAILDRGALVQCGTPREIVRAPRDVVVRRLLETPRRQAKALEHLFEADVS